MFDRLKIWWLEARLKFYGKIIMWGIRRELKARGWTEDSVEVFLEEEEKWLEHKNEVE